MSGCSIDEKIKNIRNALEKVTESNSKYSTQD